MRSHAILRGPGPVTVSLGPGDIVGRSWCASLHIDDARISEAHALVSLRGDALRLLALRGRFAVDGRVVQEVDLCVGQRIQFAPGLAWDVIDVVLPDQLLGLEGNGLAPVPLHGAAALMLHPEPALAHPMADGAVAWLWPAGEGFRLRVGEGPARSLVVGEPFVVQGSTFRLTVLARTPSQPTQERSAVTSPLRIVARYETVHIHRRGIPALVLDGVQARLVSELVAFGVPVAWRTLASELWPELDDPTLARKRLDGALARLRARLAVSGLRPDLVRNNGQGQFELLLDPQDSVEDQL